MSSEPSVTNTNQSSYTGTSSDAQQKNGGSGYRTESETYDIDMSSTSHTQTSTTSATPSHQPRGHGYHGYAQQPKVAAAPNNNNYQYNKQQQQHKHQQYNGNGNNNNNNNNNNNQMNGNGNGHGGGGGNQNIPRHNEMGDANKFQNGFKSMGGSKDDVSMVKRAAAGGGGGAGKDEDSKNDDRCVGEYRLGETIGMGGYSKVKLGYHVQTGVRVALKIMFSLSGKSDEKTRRHLFREINVMKTVKHPNVLSLIDFYETAKYPETNGKKRDCLVTILEYAPCGELFDYLMFTGHFGEVATRTYTHQMMDGLHAMHKKGFAHRDLKPENLLLDSNFTLKIADFGFARSFVDPNDIIIHMNTTCGTKGYLAPEVLERKPYTYKADLFTMGIIIFTTYCAFPPFQEAADTDWWWKRLSKGISYLERSKKYSQSDPAKAKQYTLQGIKSLTQFWDNHTKRLKIDQEFQELMINMLHPSPDRRFNHQQIRNHKWYNQRIMTTKELQDFMRERVKKVTTNRQKKVEQMLRDRITNLGYDPSDVIEKNGYVTRAGKNDTNKEELQTKLGFFLANSNITRVMDQIDPNGSFLDNIEYEKDMPQEGVRHSFNTLSDPREIAARLQIATDNMGEIISGKDDPSVSPSPESSRAFVVTSATCQAFPNDNMSIMNVSVAWNGVRHLQVAIRIKQYIKGDSRYDSAMHKKLLGKSGKKRNNNDGYGSGDDGFDDEEDAALKLEVLKDDANEQKVERHNWNVVFTKLKGNANAFEVAVADLLSTCTIFEVMEKPSFSMEEESGDSSNNNNNNNDNENDHDNESKVQSENGKMVTA